MQNKLQELTDKLYEEGLSKGKAEGERVIAEALKEADRLVAEAKEQAEQIGKHLPDCAVSADDEWISVLVNEEKQRVMDVLTQLQKEYRIRDMQLEEIATEDVIKKIYEEGVE